MWSLPQVTLSVTVWGAWLARAGTVNKDTPVLAKDIASPVELEQREERLRNGLVEKRYHQTSLDACRAIMKSRFYIGKSGIAGGGIYWAEKAAHTQWKAEKNGCLIEAWVAIGKEEKLEFKGDRSITPQKMLRAGFDSVWLPRGCRGPPCLNAPTPETVIYFSDQILEMTAAPCRKDGTITGGYFPDKYGHSGPLSATPPAFEHSEGIDGHPFTVQYQSIGDVPDHSDLCPACPMCDVPNFDIEASPTVGNTGKGAWIPVVFGTGVFCIAVGAIFIVIGSRRKKARRNETSMSKSDSEAMTPLAAAE